jgi:hypothetical protein
MKQLLVLFLALMLFRTPAEFHALPLPPVTKSSISVYHPLLVGLLMPRQSPTIYYVATSGGSDSNTCMQAQTHTTAKATIAAGIACTVAGDGDEVHIKAGTYTEFDLTPKAGFSAGFPSIIRNYLTDEVIIRPTDEGCGRIFEFQTENYISFIGNGSTYTPQGGTYKFQLDGNDVCLVAIDSEEANTMSDSTVISGLLIEDFETSGVLIGGYDNLVENSFLLNNGKETDPDGLHHCIYSATSESIFEDLSFLNCHGGYGFQLRNTDVDDPADDPGAADDNIVRRIHCKQNSSGCMVFNGESDNLVENSVSESDGDHPDGGWGGFRVSGGNGNIMRFNTVYDAEDNAGLTVSSGTDNVVCNNVTWASVNSNLVDDDGTSTDGCVGLSVVNSNRSTDPGFVNAGAGDFDLTATLDDGLATAGVTTDFDGNTRCDPPDRGAFEEGTGGCGGTPPAGGTLPIGGGGVISAILLPDWRLYLWAQ